MKISYCVQDCYKMNIIARHYLSFVLIDPINFSTNLAHCEFILRVFRLNSALLLDF